MAYTHTPPPLLRLPVARLAPPFAVEHRGDLHRVAAVRDVGDGLHRIYVKVYSDPDASFDRFYDVCRSDVPPQSKVAT